MALKKNSQLVAGALANRDHQSFIRGIHDHNHPESFFSAYLLRKLSVKGNYRRANAARHGQNQAIAIRFARLNLRRTIEGMMKQNINGRRLSWRICGAGLLALL